MALLAELLFVSQLKNKIIVGDFISIGVARRIDALPRLPEPHIWGVCQRLCSSTSCRLYGLVDLWIGEAREIPVTGPSSSRPRARSSLSRRWRPPRILATGAERELRT